MELKGKEKVRYEAMVKMWNALELSEKNRELVEQYMNIREPENRELLKEVEFQSLKRDWMDKNRLICIDYFRECEGKHRREEIKRYVSFVVAVGHFTAYYMLTFLYHQYFKRDNVVIYITPEQWVGIQTEDIVWNAHSSRYIVNEIEQKEPDVLRKAMSLPCHEDIQTKILIAAFYLFYTKSTKEKENQEMIEFIIREFSNHMEKMLKEGEFSQTDIEKLQNFIVKSEGSLEEMRVILHGKKYNIYLIKLMAASLFLSIRHMKGFVHCLHLLMLMDIENGGDDFYITLNSCLKVQDKRWFNDHISIVEKNMPIEIEKYIIWCEKNEIGEAIRRISIRYPESIRQIKDKMSAEEFFYVLYWTKKGNLQLYEELKDSFPEEHRIQQAYEIVGDWWKNCKIAQRYLVGKVEVKELYSFVKEWRECVSISSDIEKKIIAFRTIGNQAMYQRAVVLMVLLLKREFFLNHWIEERENEIAEQTDRYQDKAQLDSMIRIFAQEKLSVNYQVELLANMYYNKCFNKKIRKIFLNNCMDIYCTKRMEWEYGLTSSAKRGSIFTRLFCIQLLDIYWYEYKGILIDCVEDLASEVQALLIPLYESHKTWEKDIVELLDSPRIQEREVAVHVLARWGISNYRKQLLQTIEKEKTKTIRNLIKGYLKMPLEKTTQEAIKETFKGGRKWLADWLYETPLPVVHKLDGTEASEDYMKAILVAYAIMKEFGIAYNAQVLAEELDVQELNEYMKQVFYKWLEQGAPANKKWVLYAVSIHGGEDIIPLFYEKILEWPSYTRGVIAIDAMKALSLNGSLKSLFTIDYLSRTAPSHRTKKSASKVLQYAADQFGITREELEERIIPEFGFNKKMERTFDYGTRKFILTLTKNLELVLVDDQGRSLTRLPDFIKKYDEEKVIKEKRAYQVLKGEFKRFVLKEKKCLEQALNTGRFWTVQQWKELFIDTVVMNPFAISLIWGHYENDELKETFRYNGENHFLTAKKKKYQFPKTGMIQLVCKETLSEQELNAWKAQLVEDELIQPIQQLN